MPLLLLFIDGLGVGEGAPWNPLYVEEFPGLARLMGGVLPVNAGEGDVILGCESAVRLVDATFGVPGLPESATGQTALLTGLPAPQLLGRHISGFPTSSLLSMLYSSNILKLVRERGGVPTFLNAFRDLDEHGLPRGRRLSCTTHATIASRVPFRGLSDVFSGEAVCHDITCETVIAAGYVAPRLTPEEAAEAACRVAAAHDFTLFEYFMTDRAGHTAHMEECLKALGVLDRFIQRVLEIAELSKTLSVALASDHGNIEDARVGTHTRNPVPFAIWGGTPAMRQDALSLVKDIAGVTSALMRWIFSEAAGGNRSRRF